MTGESLVSPAPPDLVVEALPPGRSGVPIAAPRPEDSWMEPVSRRMRRGAWALLGGARIGAASGVRSAAGLVALQDAILGSYLLLLGAVLLRSDRIGSAKGVLAWLGLLVLGCLMARGLPEMSRPARLHVYRGVLVGTVVFDYLSLHDLLPMIRPDAVDASLLGLDRRLFGLEPALWLERFNHRPLVEWFSFFYVSYFVVLLVYTVAAVWLAPPGRATAEFAIGTALVYCIGQLGYMLVPAYGPVVAMADSFHAPLDGGFFWSCVGRVVRAGGALKDVFPSLHTAAPVWLTLHAAARAREDARWRWPAIVTGFFAANIVVSTMFLRWHYAVDVIAGLVLAFAVAWGTPRLARWEERRRERLGCGGAWVLP